MSHPAAKVFREQKEQPDLAYENPTAIPEFEVRRADTGSCAPCGRIL